jgi:hypothetical protein
VKLAQEEEEARLARGVRESEVRPRGGGSADSQGGKEKVKLAQEEEEEKLARKEEEKVKLAQEE